MNGAPWTQRIALAGRADRRRLPAADVGAAPHRRAPAREARRGRDAAVQRAGKAVPDRGRGPRGARRGHPPRGRRARQEVLPPVAAHVAARARERRDVRAVRRHQGRGRHLGAVRAARDDPGRDHGVGDHAERRRGRRRAGAAAAAGVLRLRRLRPRRRRVGRHRGRDRRPGEVRHDRYGPHAGHARHDRSRHARSALAPAAAAAAVAGPSTPTRASGSAMARWARWGRPPSPVVPTASAASELDTRLARELGSDRQEAARSQRQIVDADEVVGHLGRRAAGGLKNTWQAQADALQQGLRGARWAARGPMSPQRFTYPGDIAFDDLTALVPALVARWQRRVARATHGGGGRREDAPDRRGGEAAARAGSRGAARRHLPLGRARDRGRRRAPDRLEAHDRHRPRSRPRRSTARRGRVATPSSAST